MRREILAVTYFAASCFFSRAWCCENPYCRFTYLGGRSPIVFDGKTNVYTNLNDWQRKCLTLQDKWFISLYEMERAYFANDKIGFANRCKDVKLVEDDVVSFFDGRMKTGFVALMQISILRMMLSDNNDGTIVNATTIEDLMPSQIVDAVLSGVETWGAPRNAKRTVAFRDLMIVADAIISYKRKHGRPPPTIKDLYMISPIACSKNVLYLSNGTAWRIFLDIEGGCASSERIFVPTICELAGIVKTYTVQISDDFSSRREALFYGTPIVENNPKWSCYVDHKHPVFVRGHPLKWGDGRMSDCAIDE